MARHFSKAHEDQLAAWLADGYSQTEIVKKIDRERARGVSPDPDEPWPPVSRTRVDYWKGKFADDALSQLQTRAISVSAGTAVATRSAAIRRAARALGQLETTIDELVAELETLIGAGVLTGLPYHQPDNPDVYEAEYTTDGREHRAPAPIAYPADLGPPADDPRYPRLVVLLNTMPKWFAAYEKQLALIAKLGGLGQGENDAKPDERPPEERLRRATALFADLRQSAPAGAGQPRR